MFSKTCEYAIRALIFIAQKSKDGSRISIKDISSGIDSPEYFIAKILQDLSRKGFVQSAKGGIRRRSPGRHLRGQDRSAGGA